MADNQYKISLGIKLDTKDLQTQINRAGQDIAPIDIKVDAETKELTKTINEALKSLSNGSKNALTLDTSKLEGSLKEVKDAILDIKNAFGTLDDKSGMKSLLSSINQIATTIGKVTDETDTLVKSLNTLSKKEFGFNFNLKTGNTNPLKAATDYGKEARRNAIPALQEQATALQNLLGGYLQADKALERYLTKIHKASGISIKNSLVDDMSDTSSIAKQMEAIEKYIGYLRKIAVEKGIDLSGFDAQFSKAAQNIVDDTVKIQTGAKQTEEALEEVGKEMKKIFGGGVSAEGLTASLDPIIIDLNKIRETLEELSKGFSLQGLTASFDRLSGSIENLLANAEKVKGVLNSGFDGSKVGSTSTVNTEPIKSAQQVLNIDDVIDKEVLALMKEYGIKGNKNSNAFKDIRQSLANYRSEFKSIGNLDVDNDFGSYSNVDGIRQVTSALAANKKETIELDAAYDKLLEDLKSINKSGQKVNLVDEIKQEWGDDYSRNRGALGSAFATGHAGDGIDLSDWISDKSWSHLIDLNQSAQGIADDLLHAVNQAKNRTISGDELFNTGYLKIDDVEASVVGALGNIEKAEQQLAKSSVDSTNTIVKNEQRKQQEYEETLAKQKQRVEEIDDEIDDYSNRITDPTKLDPDIDYMQQIQDYQDSIDRLEQEKASLLVSIEQTEAALEREAQAMNQVTDATKNNQSNAGVENLESDLKQVENAAEQTSDAIQQIANETKKLDDVSIDISDGNVEDLKNALKGIKLDDSDIDDAIRELNEMNVVASKVSGTLKNNNLAKFEIKGVQTTADGLERVVAITKTLGEEGWSTSTKYSQAFDKIADSAQKIQNKLNDTGFNGFEQEVRRAHTAAEELAGVYPDLEAALKRLDVAMAEVYSADQSGDVKRLVAANEEYESVLKQVYSQLKLNQQAEQKAYKDELLSQKKSALSSEMEIWLKDNTRAARDFGDEIKRLQLSLNGLDDKGVKLVGQQFKNLTKQAQVMGKTGLTVFDKLKSKAKEYMTYLSAAELFMYAEQAFRSMFEQVKLIDSAMTELKKVTDETDESYNRFLTNAATRAKEIGTTIDGLVSSTADFARLGYEFADAQGLAEVANIYAVVGDDIEGVEGATQSLISTLTAFKNEMGELSDSDFALSIVDKMNEVSNNFAISSGGIGEALQRSASSMMAANNSLDETIALITAANTVVQDPASVGQAFKTISMRIRGAKTELEEAGLETEGMVESTAKLRSEIMALTGVDIMDGANQFKSTYQIMDELADKWQDLTDIQQATVTELIAGKRQGNIVSSLMNNFDIAEQALETSLNSAGSAMKEHEKWQQSLEAQILKLKASWQSLSQAFLSSDFLKVAFDGIINLVDGITKLIDTFGAFPTLMGSVATGLSVFKNVGVFKTLTSDLEGFINKIGIANRSFADLVNAFKSGSTNGGLKGGLSAIKNSLSGGLTKADIANIQAYNKEIENGVSAQTAWYRTMQTSSDAAQNLVASANGSKVAINGMKTASIGAKVALIGAKVAAVAFNAALTMGISFLIDWAISGIMKLVNAKKELAEQVDEITSKFKEQSNELKKLQGDYDTTNESSMISRYKKLSKGVDNLGRNVSLTADEYSEYQSIVNKIADQIPSLVSGYDSQGNAILSCKGNVEELTQAYEKLIHAQNQEILSRNAADIEKNFKNKLSQSNGYDFWEFIGNAFSWDGMFGGQTEDYDMKSDTAKWLGNLTSNTSKDDIKDYLSKANSLKVMEIIQSLQSAGYDVNKWSSNAKVSEVLSDALKNEPEKIKGILDNYYAQFDEAITEYKTLAQAKLSEAFDISSAISGVDYGNISEDLQAVAYQVVESLDKDFFDELQNEGKSIEDWTTEMLDQLNTIGKDDSAEISAAFDLQTQFNGGEIPYGEYVNGLKNAGKLIDSLDLSEELETQLKLSLGLNEKGFVEEYQRLRNRLADDELFDIMPEDYVPFIEGLSSEELSVLIDIIPELSETEYRETIDDVKAALEKEMMLQGLTFDLNLEVESAGLEALNTALAESVSATGLSSDSISALKGRYADLESQGYDLSSMFEETSTGIRLNRKEFNKLEKLYGTQKLADIDSDLAEMKSAYDDLGEAIKNCDDPIKKSELFNDRQTLAKRISEAATLASQYEGLTSAYNDWLSAEEAGQERDMYENIISGFETVDDEIARGWIDDAAIEFLELLTGRTDLAGKSGKQLKEVYDSLDDTIKNTTYSIRDFFTVDEDGNSTNAGVYNFLDAIGQLEEEKFGGKDVVKRDDDGNVIGFDFQLVGGDEAIAEALGVSEELVQIMVRAADDAGFVISMDGTYRQLADLQNEAKAAADYLREIGKTDFQFDFNTSSVENLKTQLEEAHKILDDKKFWNKDGTFNFNADGATQAMQVVSTLQAKLDKLTEEQYGIGLTVENEEFEEPLENLQEYGRTVQTLNQLKLNPKVNAEEIKECETRLDELAQEFNELDTEKKLEIGLEIEKGVALTQENLDKLTDEKKIKLGFVGDDGKPLTNVVDVIQNKIESGEITIPTVLDIQANMDKNIEKLADLAWLNSEFLTDDEEEVIRKKYNIKLEGGDVDDSDVEEKVEKTVHGGGGGKFTLSREANIEIIANTFGIEDVDGLTTKLKELDDKEIEAVAKVIGKIQVDELKQAIALLKPKEVEAIANAIGKGDVVELSDIIGQLSPKTVDAIANALGYDDVNDLRIAIENLDPKTVEAVANALGITDVESLKAAIDNVKGKDVEVNATTSGETKLSGLKKIIDSIKSKTVTITSWFKKIVSGGSTRNDSNGFSDVNGTANVNGTTGRAFRHGSWGTKNSGTALVGELGRETLVRNGRYYTIGDNGAEFIKYQKGDIIFNHRQTEELFANGRITSDGGRGKAFAEGTAFSRGIGGIGKITSRVSAVTADGEEEVKTQTKTNTQTKSSKKKTVVTTTIEEDSSTGSTGGGNNSSTGSKGGGGIGKVDGSAVGTEKDKKEFEEVFDWVETAISRIEREIDNLDRTANSTYKSWSERNTALVSEISKVSDEIRLQEKAATTYLSKANSIGLDESWAKKIREGALDIDTLNQDNSNEELVEKIKNYQKWYELYLDCIDAAEELKETEASLYAQRFENVQNQYEDILHGFDHTESMLNEYISQAEEQGHIVSKKYYEALTENEKDRIATLKQEQAALIAERDAAVASGEIKKGSQKWHEFCKIIDTTTQSIEEGETAILSYAKSMKEIDWEVFDLIQQRISDVTDEANFYIELMSHEKLFDDNNKLTDQGLATLGLHAQNYNTSMYQADLYGEEAAKIKKQLDAIGEAGNQDLENRYRELIGLQREYILEAENQKDAIVDLVREGIELEIDALDEKIQKYNDALQSQKDLFDYQKKVEKQTKEISSLQKQLAAYEGDNSEEAKAKIQELRVSLEEAEADLQETEYEKFINDQSALLDNLFLEYENLLNERLDNTDDIVRQVVDAINGSTKSATAGSDNIVAQLLGSEGNVKTTLGNVASTIKTTLETEATSVGTTLSTAMSKIWTTPESGTNSILSMYGSGIQDDLTGKDGSLKTVLEGIAASVGVMVEKSNKEAEETIKKPATNPSSITNPITGAKENKPATTTKPASANTSSNSKNISNATLMGIAAAIWVHGSKAGWENDPTRKNKLGEKLGEENAKKVQQYINKYSSNGALYRHWFDNNLKLSDYSYSAFKLGARKIDESQLAWTQEQGKEFIVRPSDGAILTPVAKGDSILTSAATNNIWQMANSPAEFIKDNLNLGSANVPNNSTVQSSYSQHIDNVVFKMDGVKNYDEMLAAMQKDKNFERLITSMSIDRLAGKSSLAKGKAIR